MQPRAPSVPKPRSASKRLVTFQDEREARALRHWEKTNKQWGQQLQHLAKKTGAAPEALSMQSHETKRQQAVARDIIDRALPSVEGGKGHRVGSEFWNQQATSAKAGLHFSTTRMQRGEVEGVEFIGRPRPVQQEMGVGQPPRTWGDRSSYLANRRMELLDTLMDVAPHEPDVEGLYVRSEWLR